MIRRQSLEWIALPAVLILLCVGRGLADEPQAALLSNTDQPKTADGLRLTIVAEDLVGRQLQPIRVKVTLFNESSEDVQLPTNDQPNLAFQLAVTTVNGVSLPASNYGRVAALGSGGDVFRNMMDHLAPGQSESAEVAVNLLYDMSVPGKYVIRSRHEVFNHDDRTRRDTAISNSVTVQVEPSEWASPKMVYTAPA